MKFLALLVILGSLSGAVIGKDSVGQKRNWVPRTAPTERMEEIVVREAIATDISAPASLEIHLADLEAEEIVLGDSKVHAGMGLDLSKKIKKKRVARNQYSRRAKRRKHKNARMDKVRAKAKSRRSNRSQIAHDNHANVWESKAVNQNKHGQANGKKNLKSRLKSKMKNKQKRHDRRREKREDRASRLMRQAGAMDSQRMKVGKQIEEKMGNMQE